MSDRSGSINLAKPLGQLILFSAVYLTACTSPPIATILAGSLLTEENLKSIASVMGWIGSVLAGNVANKLEKVLPEGNDYVSLENEDLIRVSGRAIAGMIAIVAKEQKSNRKISKHLEQVAAKTPENWVNLVRSELAQHKDDKLAPHKYAELMEGQLPFIITPTKTGLTQDTSLTETEWRNIFNRLDLMAVDSAQGVNLPDSVLQQVAKLLHTTFPKALRQALKEDFKKDGKAFAGLTIQLLTGISAELGKLQESQKQNFQLVFDDFQRIKTQLQGTEAQQQIFFTEVAEQIDSGFAEVCKKLNIAEESITQLLKGVNQHLAEISQQQQIDSTKIENIESKTEEIWNNLDPKRKLCTALTEFNYNSQVSLFQSLLEEHKFGACLIHGSPESEHLWLLYRLIERIFPDEVYRKISGKKLTKPLFENQLFGLLKVKTTSFHELLKSIYRRLAAKSETEPVDLSMQELISKIKDIVLGKWQTQSIILTLTGIENFASEDINNFIREFWIPLADAIDKKRAKNPHHQHHRLFLFLIDSQESGRDQPIFGVNQILSHWTPRTLLTLEVIQPLSKNKVEHWLKHCLVKAQKTEGEINIIMESILSKINENTKYTHQEFLEQMCELMVNDLSWSEIQKKLKTR